MRVWLGFDLVPDELVFTQPTAIVTLLVTCLGALRTVYYLWFGTRWLIGRISRAT